MRSDSSFTFSPSSTIELWYYSTSRAGMGGSVTVAVEVAYSSVVPAQHVCDGPLCNINISTGYYLPEASQERERTALQSGPTYPTVELLAVVLSGRYCITAQGSATAQIVEDYLKPDPEKLANIRSRESEALFATYCEVPLAVYHSSVYHFNLSSPSTQLHPFLFSEEPDGVHKEPSPGSVYPNSLSYYLGGVEVSLQHYQAAFAEGQARQVTFRPTPSEPGELFYFSYGIRQVGASIAILAEV